MREHIGKPSLRIDAVELGREISVNMNGGSLPSAIGSREEPCLAVEDGPENSTFSSSPCRQEL
jgi:hypothetical protein